MYGYYSRVVSNQERVIVARVRYLYCSTIIGTKKPISTEVTDIPYSREQKHISFSNMSQFVTLPRGQFS
jgi:hypothetical protein